MKTCENCGCKKYNGRCVNCHEELYILDQYYEQDIPKPKVNTTFMNKVEEQLEEISKSKD